MRTQFLIGLVVAATVVYSCIGDFGVENVISISNAAVYEYAPKISIERGIKVTAALQNIPSGAKTWDFLVTLESHTQDLSDDLSKSSMLIADGKQYTPLGWEGAPPGGHHRKGILHFKAISPQPASVELQIDLAGDRAARSFKWLLK